MDLTGHRITVQNGTGMAASWFYTLHGDFSQRPSTGSLANIQPIFPLQLYSSADDSGDFLFQEADNGLALQNPSPSTVTVSLQLVSPYAAAQTSLVTLPPGASFLELGATFVGRELNTLFHIIPSAPIRIAAVGPDGFHTVKAIYSPPAAAQVYVNGTSQALGESNPLQVNWTYGTPAPAPITLAVEYSSPLQFSVTVAGTNTSGISVSPLQGSSCSGGTCSPPSTITVAIDPSGFPNLSTGQTLTITVASQVLGAQPLTIPIFVTVTANPNLPAPPAAIAVQSSLAFAAQIGQPAPASQTLNISPTYGAFTLSTQTSSGGNWLSVGSSSGPGVPYGVVSVNPAGLSAGIYQGAIILVTELGGTGQVPVTLYVYSTPPPVTISPASLSFTAIHGQQSASRTIQVSTGSVPLPLSVGSTTYSTSDSWLIVAPAVTGTVPYPLVQVSTPDAVVVTADATNLAVGTYTATLTLISPTASGNSASIPVSLTVTPEPQPLPQPGTVPLTTAVLNGASQTAAPLAPGEIVTIFGQNFGPAQPAGLVLASNKVGSIDSGVQVLFNNVPAPLLYVSATQINAIVPYEVAGTSAAVSIQFNGAAIPAGTYSVAATAPAIFALNSSGEGPGAVLNQDATINSAANPAARGSIVQIYATGAGQTQPGGVTGAVTASTGTQPLLPVSVTIGGIPATLTYDAEAPGEVSGVFQVNAVVPGMVAPGSAVPVVLTVGSVSSPAAATIAVK
jgi:uncharacterized protein (TIGR03437 family)